MNYKNFILLLILLFLTLRVLLFNINSVYSWDEAIYLSHAEGIAAGKGYGYVGDHKVEGYRPPFFPFILSLSYLINGEMAAKLLISLISILSIALFYCLSKDIFDRKLALLSTLFLATNHMHLFFSYRIMAENLALLLVTLDFYLFYLLKKDLKFLPFLGLSLALTLLTKYNLLVIGPIFLLFLIIFDRKLLLKVLSSKYFYLGIMIFLVVLFPWLWYQFKEFGSLIGAPVAQLKEWKLFIPFRYFLLAPLALGFVLPFTIFGLSKMVKEQKKWIVLLVLTFTSLFLFSQGIRLQSMRYIHPILPFFGIISVCGLSDKKKIALFTLLCIFNMLVGYFVIFQYISPLAGMETLPEFLTPGKPSYFRANLVRKEAALYIKNMTNENSTVMSGASAWLWVYTHRNFVPIPDTEEEFWKKVNQYNISYIYLEPGPINYLEDNPKIENIQKNIFIEVYRVKV
ncbi:MAG: glycosyltransferase family 39 protein [Candidatus Aenigmarchaeota archaeon]|nr:glycosyltransferase family 39 protein [Candidatus Aenigmarchaeota archaeon]